MSAIISIENLSKAYQLGKIGSGTLANDLKIWWAKVRGKPNPMLKIGERDHGNHDGETVWALRNVSFQLDRGEVLGIIGHNGAGKSTLLKILSQVTAPTSGVVKAKGRVASLLEVGTGFHPELTGRENVFLNGAILGMSRSEVQRKFDEIVDFSGVEQYVDTPVKRYSSGMQVRLAFAVAAHLEPEILVVDEVLAVGDASFQKKSLGKMGEVANEGRTILFVSHNMTAVKRLCERGVLLNAGSLVDDGPVDQVVSNYLQQAAVSQNTTERDWDVVESLPGNAIVRIRNAFVRTSNQTASDYLQTDQELEVGVKFSVLQAGHNINVTFVIANSEGITVFATSTVQHSNLRERKLEKGLHQAKFRIPADLLNTDVYRARIMFVEDEARPIFKMEDILTFEVADSIKNRGSYLRKRPGVIAPILEWDFELLSESIVA